MWLETWAFENSHWYFRRLVVRECWMKSAGGQNYILHSGHFLVLCWLVGKRVCGENCLLNIWFFCLRAGRKKLHSWNLFVYTLEPFFTGLSFLHAWTLKIAWTLLKIGCVALLLGWAALPSVQLHLNPETEFGFFLEKKITQELGRQFLLGKKKHI